MCHCCMDVKSQCVDIFTHHLLCGRTFDLIIESKFKFKLLQRKRFQCLTAA